MKAVSPPWALAPGLIAFGGIVIGIISMLLILKTPLSAIARTENGFLALCAVVAIAGAAMSVPVTRIALRASGGASISIKTHLWCCALAYPLALSSAQQAFTKPASILLIFPALALVGTVVGNAWTLWRSSRGDPQRNA